MEQEAREIASQLVILNEIASRLRNDISQSGEASSSKGGANATQADIKRISEQVEINVQSANFVSRKIEGVESEMVEVSRKLFDIDSKLPGLNDQKKLAVSSRNSHHGCFLCRQPAATGMKLVFCLSVTFFQFSSWYPNRDLKPENV